MQEVSFIYTSLFLNTNHLKMSKFRGFQETGACTGPLSCNMWHIVIKDHVTLSLI